MMSFFLIRVSMWLALSAWFAGAWCRAMRPAIRFATPKEARGSACERIYRWSWLWSAVATWVHVIASYELVHGWDHQAVLDRTAEESFQATGWRAGWGVYVNFAYAGILLAYSLAMLGCDRRLKILDSSVFWFTTFIVFNAAIVFETGALRVITSLAFAALFALMIYRRFRKPAPGSGGS